MADTLRAGAYHLAGNPSKYQPVRQNNFTFLVDASENSPLYSLRRVNENPEDANSYINNGQEVLEFSVLKFDVPHFSQDEIEIGRGNSKIYFAGRPSFTAGKLEVQDFMSADSKSVIMAWQALSYDIASDSISNSDKYKANATVYEYMPDGTLIRSWALYGCWVKSISETGWDNEAGSKKTLSCDIRYDRAVPTLEYNR